MTIHFVKNDRHVKGSKCNDCSNEKQRRTTGKLKC